MIELGVLESILAQDDVRSDSDIFIAMNFMNPDPKRLS